MALGLSCCAIAAETLAEAKKAIADTYAAISKAFVHKDAPAFKGFMTEDFQATAPNGTKLSRDLVVKDFLAQRSRLTDVTWTKTIKKIDLQGPNCHVEADGRMSAKIDLDDHKPHSFLLLASSADDWIKTETAWKLRKTKTVSFHVEIDGKAVSGG